MCTVFTEVEHAYSYDSGIRTDFINAVDVTLFALFTSVFSTGASTITASSATGLATGMVIVDNTTAANIEGGTTITVSGTSLALNQNTQGNSASSPGDTLAAIMLSNGRTSIRSVGLASKAFLINSTTTNNVYSTFSAFPTGKLPGTLALANDTGILYVFDGVVWSF